MAQTVEVKVPDIGDFTDVPVIEVLVKAGDTVKAEDSLVTLESDKATMDVPSPSAGIVKDVKVKLGDKVSEGSVIVTLEAVAGNGAKTASPAQAAAPVATSASAPATGSATASAAATSPAPPASPKQRKNEAPSTRAGAAQSIEVKVPDIGDFKDVPVIEVLVKAGDTVKAEDSLVTLESDKATMDVPSPSAGVIKEVKVKLGDKVSEGNVIVVLEASAARASAAPAQAAAATATPPPAPPQSPSSSVSPDRKAPSASSDAAPQVDSETFRKAHASPSVRAFARELGVDLSRVKGSGPKNRVLREDVQKYVKDAMTAAASSSAATSSAGGAALGLLPWPQVDFAKFGPVEAKPLSRIKKISGANLHRNWVMIPHVTNHDDADITDLEALRVTLNKESEKTGLNVTMLAFLIKVCVSALKKFPEFNASLDGDNLIY